MRTFRSLRVRVRLACCSRAALLCALGLCAMPQNAQAQQSNSVPVLGDLPLIGRLYATPPVAKAPVLSDLPLIGKLYRITPKTPVQPKAPGGQDSSSQFVSVEAKSATLGQVIELLMDQAHVSYTLDHNLEKIPVGSLKLRKVLFEVALRTVLKSTAGRATYIREDGIYRILPQEYLDAEQPPRAAPAPVPLGPAGKPEDKVTVEALAPQPGADAKFNLNVNDASLYDALKQLFSQAKLNYFLDPALRSLPITAHLNGVPLRAALETLLHGVDSAVPLTYRVENGVYQIVEKVKEGADGAKP